MARARKSHSQPNVLAGFGPPRAAQIDRAIDPRAFGLVKAAYGIREAIDVLSIGRTSLYAAIKRGELRPVKFGRKTLFYAADLSAFLVKLRAASAEEEQDRERR
jgi:excisionase family DNA binding protein